MEDPLKVFLGQLHHGINKPQIIDALQAAGLPWVDIIVPQAKQGVAQAVAFVIVGSIEDGRCLVDAMHGRVDAGLSATWVQAARTNMGALSLSLGGLHFLFNFRLYVYIGLDLETNRFYYVLKCLVTIYIVLDLETTSLLCPYSF